MCVALTLLFLGIAVPLSAAVIYKVQNVYNDVGDVVAVRRYTNETSYV